MYYKAGQKIRYMHYGEEKTGIIASIGTRSGIIFLTDGKWLFPQSVLGIVAD